MSFMDCQTMHPADQIVATMNRIYYGGMTSTSGGNLSVLDKDGSMWVSPSGIDKGSLTRRDIMHILPDGRIEGIHKPSVEYPFHQAILRARPDLGAVLHAHPTPLIGFSLMRKIPDLSLLPEVEALCGKITMARYAIPGSQELGEIIAAEFAKGAHTVMLENHGVVIGAPTLYEAFRIFETLDITARIQIAAATMGKKAQGPSAAERARYAAWKAPVCTTLAALPPLDEEAGVRASICRMARRAYDLGLFSAVDGVISVRLSDDSQLITPEGGDAYAYEPGELVRVRGTTFESGKTPSRYANICTRLYEKYPEFGSVTIARCPSIMAFAQTDADFDARLIPESYINLKATPVLPFQCLVEDPDRALAAITPKNPVAIVKGDCVIACAGSLTSAYDHLEVLDYSARALISCAAVGEPVVKLSDAEIQALHKAFNL